MKKALISPEESIRHGYRVADVSVVEFDVASPLFWVDCDELVTRDGWLYNPQTKEVEQIPPKTTEELAEEARLLRTIMLAETDWIFAADIPQNTKDIWTPYRQALRDVPQQTGFPTAIVWPVKPESQNV